MLLKDLKQELSQRRNGSFATVTWKSELPVKAAFKESTVEKITTGVVRFGVSYAQLKSVKETGITPQELPWGQWKAEIPKVLIEHKGADYVRVTHSNNPKHKARSSYLINGKPATAEEVKSVGFVQESYWNRKNDSPVFTIKLENIITIKEKRK